MLIASVICHAMLGALFALIFVLFYINVDGKWKIYVESLIGIGGNSGGIFVLDKLFSVEDITIRMYSISSCIGAFLLFTFILLFATSIIIKDKDDKDILRLRDILLGKSSWINTYYEKRTREIDEKLDIPLLEAREKEISKKEEYIELELKHISEEKEKINQDGNKKLKLQLPENASIFLNKEYIDMMPSYIGDFSKCIGDLNGCTKMYLDKPIDEFNLNTLKAYLGLLATHISNDMFGGKSTDVRVHFRYYNKEKDGYEKLIAIVGSGVVTKNMTFIPYNDDSMIKKSYECKRALIKSINSSHDYKGDNHTTWQDYMTYTFYNLKVDGKPYLSFGISVKNEARYKKLFHFLNYFKLENYLQENIEKLDEYINLESILYEV